MDLKKLLRRKPARQREESEAEKATGEVADASSLPYVDSPSALQYPGVKTQEKLQTPAKPKAVEIPRQVTALPRCPSCGWSVGYTDEKCSNCGYLLKRMS